MYIGNALFPLSPVQIRIRHFSDNRARTNQRNLRDQIVKACWIIARKRRHLSTAFDLEHADGICFADRLVYIWTILWQVREVNFLAVMTLDQSDAVFKNRHHA